MEKNTEKNTLEELSQLFSHENVEITLRYIGVR